MCLKRLKFIKKISIISVSRIRTNIITGYKVKLKYYIDTSEHYGGQSRKIYIYIHIYIYIYMIASTQITNNEIFTLIAALVLKLLSRNVLFKNRKDKRNC